MGRLMAVAGLMGLGVFFLMFWIALKIAG